MCYSNFQIRDGQYYRWGIVSRILALFGKYRISRYQGNLARFLWSQLPSLKYSLSLSSGSTGCSHLRKTVWLGKSWQSINYLEVTYWLFRNVVREKKRDYVGKIPKLRGGVWPKPTPYFSLLFPIQELIKWHNKFYKNGKKMWKFPNWGGGWGGSAAWEFFPHNPVFCFWQRS